VICFYAKLVGRLGVGGGGGGGGGVLAFLGVGNLRLLLISAKVKILQTT